MTPKNASTEMKNAGLTTATSIEEFLMSQLDLSSEMSSSSTLSYHEMADIPLQKVDLIEQLEGHVLHLHDLQARMTFMNREIRYLMKV